MNLTNHERIGLAKPDKCIVVHVIITGPSCYIPSVRFGSTNPTNVTLIWGQPSCSEDTTHYVIIYRQSGCCAGMSANIKLNERTFTATSLVPNTGYQFEIALANNVGVWYNRSINTTTRPLITGKLCICKLRWSFHQVKK